MRHSSWTLFLVPLTLPLVIFLFPGAARTVDQADPSVGEALELIQEQIPQVQDGVVFSGGSGDELHGEGSDALYKE